MGKMKNIILIIAIMAFVGCKEEEATGPAQDELIEEMRFIVGSYESTRLFDTIIVNHNSYNYKQGESYTIVEKENFEKSIDSIEFFKISNSINITDFFELDSIIKSANGEYPGSRDEGVYILEIILNSKSHKVKCGADSIPTIINNVKIQINELHEKLKKI